MASTVLGTIHLNGLVDITDPCYDRDVWCRLNDIPVVPGDYTAIVHTSSKKIKIDGEEFDDTRNCILGIYLDGTIYGVSEMRKIGAIGVDSGMAGFFQSPKPDYSDTEWFKLCDNPDYFRNFITENSVHCCSGYGDGDYRVFAKKNADGKCVSLEIVFI